MLELISFLHIFAYQIIHVNATTPCFLNATAGPDMWKNCGAGVDYVKFALLPFMWVTGGWFPMILAAVIIVSVYMTYKKVTYSILVGIVFMPISFALFPAQFLNFAIITACLAAGLLLVNAVVSQTTEQG